MRTPTSPAPARCNPPPPPSRHGAGLDRLSPADAARFDERNAAYRARFAMPFVIAVAGRTPADILAAFATRLTNDRATEIRIALAEIDRIARIRLHRLLDPAWT